MLEYETLTGEEINDLIKGIKPNRDDFDDNIDSTKSSVTPSVPKSTSSPSPQPQ